MVEIDHTTATKPGPAKPIIATHLLDIEKLQHKRFSTRGNIIKTGCAEVDNYVLGGGFERGITVGISSDGSDGRLVSGRFFFVVILEFVMGITDLETGCECTLVVMSGLLLS